MKNLKKVLAIFGLTAFVLLFNINVYANIIFNDVDKSNIAYSSIQKMSKMGIMLGDLQGNFKPNSYISKFEAIKILNSFINNQNINISESKYNNIVLNYDKKYNRWDSSANSSLVIMLESGLLKEEDLNNFIIIDKDNKEQVRALSKEEISLFLVKIEGKQDFVNTLNFEKVFKDEANINPNNLKACYYMDNLNIVTANANNYFYPKNAITKSELAMILDNFLNYTNINITSQYNKKYTNIQNLDNTSNIQTRFVIIEKIFIENNSIQVKIGNETKLYPVDKDAYIFIDDVSSKLGNINPNSSAEITIKDNIISKINIDTTLKINNVVQEETKLYGIIKNISNDTIGLSYKKRDDNGFYSKEKIDIIPLSSNCKITKNGITINNIEENTLATIILENKQAVEIILEDENTIFIGSIIEKSNNKITIKTTDNKIFEVGFIENANITRNSKSSSIKDLKIGDTVDINMQKDKISKISARGKKSKKQGIIKSIKINDTSSIIEIEDSKNNTYTYYTNNFTTDIYSIKVLDSVTLYLDSSEIYAIDILERKYNKNFSSEIIDIDLTKNSITVFNENKIPTSIFINNDTIIFDYETLENVYFNKLTKGEKVYVVLNDNMNNVASNINIVSK